MSRVIWTIHNHSQKRYEHNTVRRLTYMIQDKPPCINCLTLATCRSYILNNPKHHPASKLHLCRILISEIDCYDAANYIYYIDRESDIRIHTNQTKLKVMLKYLKHLR